MPQNLTINQQHIVKELKLSGKLYEIVEEFIGRQVITDTAAQLEIKASSDELQKAADDFRLSHQFYHAKDTWEWLEKQSLSLDDFEEIIHYRLITFKLGYHLFQEKIEAYFVENQLDYIQIVMYEILLNDEDLAMELYLAIENKEVSFYEVAHQYIDDIELRRGGGYRGVLSRGDLKPEVSAAVFAANPPQLLKPITTSSGIHLILVEEIIKPQLTEDLAYKIGVDLFDQWIKLKVQEVEYKLVFD
jgi:parvulin-like peptidyl-prolyl isomerase